MKIDQSQVLQQSKTTYSEKSVKEEKLSAWVDDKGNQGSSGAAAKKGMLLDLLDLSTSGLELSQTNSNISVLGTTAPQEEDLLSQEDQLKIKLIEEMLTRFTGKKFHFRHVVMQLGNENSNLSQLSDRLSQIKLGKSHHAAERPRIVLQEATQESAQVIAQSAASVKSAAVIRNADGSVQASVQKGEVQTYDATQVQINTQTGIVGGDNAGVGWGINYSNSSAYLEQETMSFRSTGTVKLQDGREITFDYAMNMSRSYYESHDLSLKAGDALKDPLVINMDGMGANLSGKTMSFDINFDGSNEDIPVLGKGSGYLVFDRNENGTLDNGAELFGTKSGHGFDELEAYDGDKNGWIDENDAIFKNLKVWVSDGEGSGKLVGLVAADVGAIYLGDVSTQYHMKDSENSTLGMVKNSSIYLKESGKVGSISELDLKV